MILTFKTINILISSHIKKIGHPHLSSFARIQLAVAAPIVTAAHHLCDRGSASGLARSTLPHFYPRGAAATNKVEDAPLILSSAR
jgi:hypothetical protein